MPTTFEDFATSRCVALTRFAYVLCGDRFTAEDLTQTALERCYRRWRLVGMAREPYAYAKKAIANEYVSSRRRGAASDLVVEHPPSTSQPDHAGTAEDRDELWTALATLTPDYRAVLVLRYYEDLEDAAIAAILGCTRGTVRSRASRALAQLRLDPAIRESRSARGAP